jgi:hypothetical protein
MFMDITKKLEITWCKTWRSFISTLKWLSCSISILRKLNAQTYVHLAIYFGEIQIETPCKSITVKITVKVCEIWGFHGGQDIELFWVVAPGSSSHPRMTDWLTN